MPFYEAVALKGLGVEETLKGATALVFRSLAARYGGPGTTPGKTGEGPGTKPPLSAPGGTGPLPRPPTVPAAGPPAARAVPSAPTPARARPPAAATATLPPTPGAEEELLESLELQPDLEEELSLEEDDSEVLNDTHPKPPRTRPGHDTVARSGPETDDLRERLRQPPSSVQFEPIEEDVEEISLDPPADEPVLRPAPAPPAAPPRRMPEAARAAEPPRPSPPVRTAPPPAAAPRTQPPVTAPVVVELKPGAPAEAEVAIPIQILVGGRATEVVVNVRLTLDLKIPR
jgi:hypothetical protein